MLQCQCDISSCFNYGMQYALQARWQAAGGLSFVPLCSYIPGIVRSVYVRQSRQDSIVQYSQPTRACIVQSAQFSTFQAISIFLQIRLDKSNCHIFPAMLYSNEVKNRGVERAQTRTHLPIFYIFPSNIQYIYWLCAKKIEPDFLMCACADYNIIIFPGKYVHIYNRIARRKRIWRLCWLVAARFVHEHILPKANTNVAQIGSDGATRL